VIPPGALPDESRFDAKDLRSQIQPPLAQPVIGKWKPPSADELRAALKKEPTFERALAAEGVAAEGWVNKFAAALARATGRDESAPGAEMIFRFPGAYAAGRVAHIANGTAWRGSDGTLQLAFLHQESLPAKQAFIGRFYDTFNTAPDHRHKIAPVAESMKLVGLPDVNVFSCKYPQSLPGITKALRIGVGDHVYAPGPHWPGVKEGAAQGLIAYGTCFTAAELGHNALGGGVLAFPVNRPLNLSFEALAPLACINLSEFSSVPGGQSAVALHSSFASTQPRESQQATFLHLGGKWGLHGPWQVGSLRSMSHKSFALEPGKSLTGMASDLPQGWTALQFGRKPSGVSLAGVPVRVGVTYTRAECEQMQVDEGGKAFVVCGHPPQAPQLQPPRPRL